MMDHSRSGPETQDGQAGFSLLELMVVVVIMSILALVLVPRIIDRPDQARIARVESDLSVLKSAVELYRLDNFRYPTTEQGLGALVDRPTAPPVPENWAQSGYIDRLPNDPWGRPYLYLQPGIHDTFDIFTLGADGQEGGSGGRCRSGVVGRISAPLGGDDRGFSLIELMIVVAIISILTVGVTLSVGHRDRQGSADVTLLRESFAALRAEAVLAGSPCCLIWRLTAFRAGGRARAGPNRWARHRRCAARWP